MPGRFRFEHAFVDAEGGYDGWGAVAVADFDGDGRPEFATGGKGGGFYHLYDDDPASGAWTRHIITHALSPNVGAAATDLDGDGRSEIVCGEWGDGLYWLAPPREGLDDWTVHRVARGLDDPHDVLAADLDGDGRDEIMVREKHGRLIVYRVPADPRAPWKGQVVARHLSGDGTALARLSRGGGLDVVTNAGWFENAAGDGTRWVRHPLVPESLNWHAETRLAVADLDGDGRPAVVMTESEIGSARLAILRPDGPGQPWRAEILLPSELDLRALHTLQVADLDRDGRLEIVTAEMENGKTDGVQARPRWWCLARDGDGWARHVLLDANLGTHMAQVADVDGDGWPDIVGKVWRANRVNGCGGRNHVDFLHNCGYLDQT